MGDMVVDIRRGKKLIAFFLPATGKVLKISWWILSLLAPGIALGNAFEPRFSGVWIELTEPIVRLVAAVIPAVGQTQSTSDARVHAYMPVIRNILGLSWAVFFIFIVILLGTMALEISNEEKYKKLESEILYRKIKIRYILGMTGVIFLYILVFWYDVPRKYLYIYFSDYMSMSEIGVMFSIFTTFFVTTFIFICFFVRRCAADR